MVRSKVKPEDCRVLPRLKHDTQVRLIYQKKTGEFIWGYVTRVGRIIMLSGLGNQKHRSVESHLHAATRELSRQRGYEAYVKRLAE